MVKRQVAAKEQPVASVPGGKGTAVEEALRLYFASLGYFAVRSVPWKLDGSDVTDIDLWLYERPSTISRRRIIVDIKNKKSPQAAERLVWTKGLQTALGVESAFVATPDRRPATHRLARSLKINLIENVPFDRITREFDLQKLVISQGQFDEMVREADATRHTNEWREALATVKASLLSGLGFQSANRCLRVMAEIYDDVVVTPPGSTRAMVGARLIYLAAACAAISLDYAMAEYVFKTKEEREIILENGIRYGSPETSAALGRIRTASGLAEKYLPNGRHFAKMMESRFMVDAERVPAGIIAEFLGRQRLVDALFDPANALLSAALAQEVPSFDRLPVGARALVGVFIDFNGGARDKFARMWSVEADEKPVVANLSSELPLETASPQPKKSKRAK